MIEETTGAGDLAQRAVRNRSAGEVSWKSPPMFLFLCFTVYIQPIFVCLPSACSSLKYQFEISSCPRIPCRLELWRGDDEPSSIANARENVQYGRPRRSVAEFGEMVVSAFRDFEDLICVCCEFDAGFLVYSYFG